MRKMKDSGIPWIGEIPEEWNIIKLKYLFSIIGGNGFPDALQGNAEGDYPFCKVSDINGSSDYVNTASNWVSEDVAEQYKFSIIPVGSIIMAKIGAALAKNHRKINTVACCIDNNTQALVLKRRDCLRYLLYLSKCIDMRWFDNNSTVPSINNSKLLSFFVPDAPKDEQQRIADSLDAECARIDAVMEQTRASIEEYKKLKQSIITEAVTKGIRPNRPMKDSGIDWIGNVPSEWKIKKTKSLSKRIVVGVVIRPADFFDENGTVPFLRGINIKEYGIQAEPMVYINEATNQLLSKSIIHSDDILIVRDGSIGTTCVVPNDYDGANVVSLIVVSCNDQVSPQYLCYSFNSDVGKTQFNLTKIGTALTHTSVQSVSNIFHILPPHEEQFEIIEYIHQKMTEIDSLVEKKNFLLTELLSYKKSLIFEYVTGKKEVGTI